MKITMYELLGMVKDGKAPIKIKYDNMIWEFDGDFYRNESGFVIEEYCNVFTSLNDEVEIIENTPKEKIPEKVDFDISKFNYKEYELNIMRNNVIANTKAINQLIDYLDYLKSKGDE